MDNKDFSQAYKLSRDYRQDYIPLAQSGRGRIPDRPFPPKKLFRVPRLSSGCSLYIVVHIDGKLGSGDRSSRSGSYLVVVVVVFRCCTEVASGSGWCPGDDEKTAKVVGTGRVRTDGAGGQWGTFVRRAGSIRIIRYSKRYSKRYFKISRSAIAILSHPRPPR